MVHLLPRITWEAVCMQAFFSACKCQCATIAQQLLSAGADVAMVDEEVSAIIMCVPDLQILQLS